MVDNLAAFGPLIPPSRVFCRSLVDFLAMRLEYLIRVYPPTECSPEATAQRAQAGTRAAWGWRGSQGSPCLRPCPPELSALLGFHPALQTVLIAG